jgi:hypothetical protein
VHPLVQFLRASGSEVFVDVQDLSHGDDWHANLMQAIDRCDRFLIFWSKQARDSGVVAQEWQRAAQNGQRRIIPVMLDQTPLPPELERFHGLSELADVFQGMIRARRATRWLWWTWAIFGPALGSLVVVFMLGGVHLPGFQPVENPIGPTPRDVFIDFGGGPDAWTPWISWQLIALALACLLLFAFWYRRRRLTQRAARLLTV